MSGCMHALFSYICTCGQLHVCSKDGARTSVKGFFPEAWL